MAEPRPAASFPILLQRFLGDHMTRHRAASPCTVAAYRDTFRLLLLFAEQHIGKAPTAVTLADLDAQLILAFLDHLEHDRGNGARSRNARLAAIRSFLRYAVHHDLSAMAVIEQALAVPMKRFDRPLLGHLDRAEMQAILDAPDRRSWAGQRDRALLTVMYNTGGRVSEILALRLGDIVLDTTPCVHIQGKGRKQRTVPLWRNTATLLRQWQRRQGHPATATPLFPNRDGAPMGRGNLAQRLTLYVRAATEGCPSLAGQTVTPHTIRHTTAMHLLQSGVDIAVIALWLGHASPTTTHMYLEADLSMKENALGRLTPPGTTAARYRPPDRLISFLQHL
jgi:site-specific recombinase XerD